MRKSDARLGTAVVCPHCRVEHDCATGVTGEPRPSADSLNVCADCGGVSVYDDELKLRLPTIAELGRGAGGHEDVADHPGGAGFV